jgi:hypothetical protein
MNSALTIRVPKSWEVVHPIVCKYFADKDVKYKYDKCGVFRDSDPIAYYKVDDDDTMFVISVYKEAVLYDNDYDIILKLARYGGDGMLMLSMCLDLENILLDKPMPPLQIACIPGECNFDDLM